MEYVVSNVPKLRFSEFGGEWEEKILGKISDVRDGTHDSPKYYDSGYPLITSKNLLANGMIDFQNVNLILEEDYININKRSKVNIGDILFGMIGTIGNPVIVKQEGFAIKNVALIKEQKILLNKFLIHYLKSSFVEKQFYKQNTGGTQKFIALGIIREMIINLPCFEEQIKIANFLSSIDKKIEQLTQKQSLLQQYKKGVMQKLFSQEIRFKDGNGKEFPEWEEKKLGDVGDIITGKTPSTSDESLWDGNIQFVTPTDISDEKYQYKTLRTVTNHSKLKILPAGSIMFTCIASIGKMSLSTQPCITNQQINSIVPNNKHNNEYIYYAVLSISDFIKSTQANTTLPIINKTEFSKFEILVPDIDEQTKIANFLSSIDKKIELISEEIDKAKEFKKGLLQQMFV